MKLRSAGLAGTLLVIGFFLLNLIFYVALVVGGLWGALWVLRHFGVL